MASRPLSLLRPETAAEAVAMAGETGGIFAGGATALQVEWEKGSTRPETLIALDNICRMKGHARTGAAWLVAALTTLGELERDTELATDLPLLHAAIRATAAPSVRNLATVGGNIAGRTGCLIPALLALDAELEIETGAGPRRISLTDWLALEEPTLVITILIPRQQGEALWTHRKVGLRAAFTPGVISVAARLTLDGDRIARARLAVGSGVVAPVRLFRGETALTGKALSEIDWTSLHETLLAEIAAPDDAFRSSAYRRTVAANAFLFGLGGVLPGHKDIIEHSSLSHPPLACRPSPPQGGRSDDMTTFANRQREISGGALTQSISPLEGEMAGRPEGGVTAAAPTEPADRIAELLLSRTSLPHRWHTRPDGPDKIAGRLRYLTDHRAPGMLVACILRAGVTHANILSIDTAAAEALPGVAAVVTHRDIAGENAFGIVVQDQPALCHDKVRYEGDAVAAVAATDEAIAERALSLIAVRFAPLPTVDDPEAALGPDAPAIHAGGNLQRSLGLTRGDVDAAFADATHIAEEFYDLPRQMHGFMETEGGYAFVAGDGTLNICAGGQHGGRDRAQLSRILDMPEEKIRVVSSPIGGGFGGKDELTVQPALALLALKTGQPVRIQLSRAESVLAGTKRHPMRIRMRTACDGAGKLLAQEVDLLADAGAYASLGPGVVETALEHAAGPYLIDNIRTRGRLAYTNNGVCGAFRGFGANQMAYAVECQLDRLAALCGLTPFEIRRRNLRKAGMPGYLGQRVAPTEHLSGMLSAAEADPIWALPRGLSPDGEFFIGTGMALAYQGTGLGTLPPDAAEGALRLSPDGAIEALYGLDEMGQGLHASIQGAVADALGCARGDIRPVTGDTGRAPDSGSTSASRGTYVVWRVAQETAPVLAAALVKAAARLLDRDADALRIVPGGVGERGSNSGRALISFADIAGSTPDDALPFAATGFEFPKSDYFEGNARLIFAFGASLARVAVSRVTGAVRVLDLHQHTAAGPILDVAAYLGQIEGGAVQGLGFTLTEDALMRDGRYLTANLDGYMLPSVADAPLSMKSFALEELDPGDPYGPRGCGELGLAAVSPAIANAIADAIGVWPAKAPVDPEYLLSMMERPNAC